MEIIRDDNELYDLINARKYSETFYKLKFEKENHSLSRSKSTVLKLLYLYYQVCDGRYVEPKIDYSSDRRNHFQRFFDSVNKKDLDEIYFQMSEIKRLKDFTLELETYDMLIDDILYQREFVRENPDFNDYVIATTKDVETLLRKKGYLSLGMVDKISAKVMDIIEVSDQATRETYFEKVYLNILDLIAYSCSHPFSLDYFDEIQTTKNKVANLLDSLAVGDYKTTYKVLAHDEQLDFNGINKTKLNILKKLVIKLNESYKYAKSHEDIIYSFVNQDMYQEAFNYILNNNVNVSPELIADLLICMDEEKKK